MGCMWYETNWFQVVEFLSTVTTDDKKTQTENTNQCGFI